jgi:hypothetical protein
MDLLALFARRSNPAAADGDMPIGLPSPMLSSRSYAHPDHRLMGFRYAYVKQEFLQLAHFMLV